MKNLIEKITEFSSIIIEGKTYKVRAKCMYVTESNISDIYAKIFLEDHHVLVISPVDESIYFGKDLGSIYSIFPTPDKIEFQKEKYKKIAEGHQIVKHLVFGSLLDAEGEVKFIDYENETDPSKLISMGLIVRTNSRANIVTKTMQASDIEIIYDGGTK